MLAVVRKKPKAIGKRFQIHSMVLDELVTHDRKLGQENIDALVTRCGRLEREHE